LLNSANGVLNFHLTDNFTVSAWVNIASVPPGRNAGLAIINKGDNQWTMEAQDTSNLTKYWLIEVRGNNNFLYARSDGTPKITANSGIGIWHHLTGTFHGAAIGQALAETLYYDGNPVRVITPTYSNNTGRNENFNVFIGVLGGGTAPGTTFSRYWPGSLDEITVSKTTRSHDWARLAYQTQKSGVNAVTLGATSPAALQSRPFERPFGIRQDREGMTFLFPKQASVVRVSLSNPSGREIWNGSAREGASELRWDRKADGHPVQSGVYFLRLAVNMDGKWSPLAQTARVVLR
jgi:hypothetical protein